MVTHPIKRFLRPEALLLGVALVLSFLNRWERPAADVIRVAPYAFALAGLAVAWRLRRSRVVFSLAVLLAGYVLMVRWLPRNPDAFQLAAILVPLNLAAVALLPERGTFTDAGLWHWGGILGQAALVALILALGDPKTPIALLRHPVVPLPPGWTGWTPLDQPALLAFLAAALLVGAGRLMASATTGTGYHWTLAATFLSFNARDPLDRTLFLAAAAGMLVISALELSYVLAYHDGLTGLPGRRALNEALERLRGTYTIAMADVDHFKRFNDTYGHEVGDEVLRTVATRLAQALPQGEVYRYGGEEFAVLFGGARCDVCLPLLERAREAVAAEPFAVRRRLRPRSKPKKPRAGGRHQEETITVSIGAAERGAKLEKADDVIAAADQALYRAKEGGRNQVRT